MITNKLERLYKKTPEAFIEDCCLIADIDDQENPIKRFKLFDYQKKALQTLLKAYRKGEDVLIEKCRQTGVSWLMCAFMLWGVLFEKSFSALLLSYKRELVDDGTVFSLLGKIEFMVEKLPKTFRDRLEVVLYRIKNRKTGGYIIGEATTSESSRGGSFKIGFWDEVAATPKSEQILAAFSQSCRSKVFVSTVRGKANIFYSLRHENRVEHIISVRWNDNPRHDDRWYAEQRKKLSAEAFQQEILIDYLSGTHGRILKLDPAIHMRNDLDWNTMFETVIAWDFGRTHYTVATVLQLDVMGKIQVIDCVYGNDLPLRVYIDAIHGIESGYIERLSVKEMRIFRAFIKNAKERGYRNFLNVCGREILQHTVAATDSIQNQFLYAFKLNWESDQKIIPHARGIYQKIMMIPVYAPNEKASVMSRIATMEKALDIMHCEVFFNARSEGVCDLFDQLNMYVWGPNGEPKHDIASDFGDSLGYGIMQLRKRMQAIDAMSGSYNSMMKHQGLLKLRYPKRNINAEELNPYSIIKYKAEEEK